MKIIVSMLQKLAYLAVSILISDMIKCDYILEGANPIGQKSRLLFWKMYSHSSLVF